MTISSGALSPPIASMAIGSMAGPGRRRGQLVTSSATRPLYHPQEGQTVCGRLAEPQRGHTLREGASSFQAPARRLRLFDFDFFFLGTAMVLSGGMRLMEAIGGAT